MTDTTTQCTSTWTEFGYDERCERPVGHEGTPPGFHQVSTPTAHGLRASLWVRRTHWTLPIVEACPRCGTYVWPAQLRDRTQCRHCDQQDTTTEKRTE